MIRLVLVGAAGQMGRAVERAALESGEFVIRSRVDPAAVRAVNESGWSDDVGGAIAPGDVVVEFSSPAGCRATARACAASGAGLVSGTTGLGPAEEAELASAASRSAVLRAANFSLGIAALRRALAAALGAVPASWDIEIVERHHRRKLDSPSGTALTLAADAASRRGIDRATLRNGREGRVGPRPAQEIGMHAVRGGSWVGDHEVLLAGDGEWIELRHVASDRAAFAHGALAAARFVASAPPGLYTLDDALSAPGR